MSRSSRSTARPSPSFARCSGSPFDLEPFSAWAAGDDVLAELVPRLAGFRPPLSPDPFEMLVGSIASQQVSLFSARAIRNRLIERFGEPAGGAWAFPARAPRGLARGGARRGRLLAPEGGVRRRARALRARPRRARRPPRRGGEGAPDRAARARRMDGGLVPRPPPRPPARLAVGRPRPAEGGRRPLSWTSTCGRQAPASIRSRTSPPTTSCSPSASRDPSSRLPSDLPLVRELWLEFEAEVPDAEWREDDSEQDVAAARRPGRGRGGARAAEQRRAGPAALRSHPRPDARVGFLDVLYVRRAARRNGRRRRASARDGRPAARAGGRGARARGARVQRGGARHLRRLGIRTGGA